MKPRNAELVAHLEELTNGLFFKRSATDLPFQTFVWEVTENGELSLEKLLQSVGIISPIGMTEFIEFISLVEVIDNASKNKYKYLIDLLQSSLETLEIFRISIFDDIHQEDYEAFHIFFGKTQDGDWISISPKVDTEIGANRFMINMHLFESTMPVKRSTLALIAELETVCSGLEFPVVEYSKIAKKEEFIIEIAENRNLIINKTLDSLGFVKTCVFADFNVTEKECTIYEKEDFQKFKRLDHLLQSNLTNLREYVIGGMAYYYLYDLGQTQDGDWVGVWTIAVWA